MAIIISSIIRGTRIASPRLLRPATILRTYASFEQVTEGQAISGTGSHVSNPGSFWAEQQQFKQSRATDPISSPNPASVQRPVINSRKCGTDQHVEDISTQEASEQDPDAPAVKKKKRVVDGEVQRPLDPTDDW